MQAYFKLQSVCFGFLLIMGARGAVAQSSAVSSVVDGGISVSASSTGTGQAPDASVSGLPQGSGRGGAGAGLFGAGGQSFNTPLQDAQQKTSNGLVGNSAVGNVSMSSRSALQAGIASNQTALPAKSVSGTSPQVMGGAGGLYTDSFPDSATGKAALSPPFGVDAAQFSFAPAIATNFSDLSQKQFLNPELHVRMSSKSKKEQQDLLQKLANQRKAKNAPKDSIFSPKKAPGLSKRPGLEDQQELKNSSTLNDQNF